MRFISLVALLVAAPAWAEDLPAVDLPLARVFPGGDGASADTLERPLKELPQAHLTKSGKKHAAKKIVVHKSKRRLDVYADEVLLKSYLVNLGLSPVGTKEHEGDARTPEGELFICSTAKAEEAPAAPVETK